MIRNPNGSAAAERVDLLFRSVLSRFFTIPARSIESGAVTFAQCRVLWVLDWKGPLALKDVAVTLGVSSPAAAELVERLVREGYVRRDRAADDRRRVVLSLRARGRGLLAEIGRRRRERFRKLLGVLGPREVARMAGALETLDGVLARWEEG
ncbi:MAG: MarR family winged helix-turn-helix transcriptional regulator [Planctomycetales bacterium]|nr:MarR family winged helix-turn-helix transcriptional regulator [Planctomycetales bacterium]